VYEQERSGGDEEGRTVYHDLEGEV
jgi:hypothetical protein